MPRICEVMYSSLGIWSFSLRRKRRSLFKDQKEKDRKKVEWGKIV